MQKETVKMQQFSKSDSGNSSSVHPVRTLEEENLDYDSNASSSSFEFHKGERSMHNPLTRSLSRPMSSKWNDAEKWIMNRQNMQANYSKKTHLQSQVNRLPMSNTVRVAPESASYDQKLSVKRVDFCQPTSQMGSEKVSNFPSGTHLEIAEIDLCPQSKDLKEVDNGDSSCTKNSSEDNTGKSSHLFSNSINICINTFWESYKGITRTMLGSLLKRRMLKAIHKAVLNVEKCVIVY
ncbi:hypothetical protein CsSME_00030053 [Camellia sinensis var. sinensis]